MNLYLLDTNTVSHIIKANSQVTTRLIGVPISSLRISAITYAEIQYGLAKRPEAKQLHLMVYEFLKYMDILPWTKEVGDSYGLLRAEMESQGKTLSPLDLQIAAQAINEKAILVTSDKAFNQVRNLKIEDWSK